MFLKSDYEDLYLSEDETFTFNDNDPDLKPVTLRLPKAPPLHLIDGYGLHPYEQKFQRHEVPHRLRDLEITAKENVEKGRDTATPYRRQKEFWRLLEENRSSFTREIDYIKKVHWHLYHGYWCFIKGKPTYLTPMHYRYLNFQYIAESKTNYHPEFRDVDKRNYYVKWYTYTAHETFKDINEKGSPDTYEMIDVGRRVFFGWGKAKRRREGQTAQCSSDNMWIAERNRGITTVIGADTGGNAEELFKDHTVTGWNVLPIFLRPINDVDSVDPKGIDFKPPRGFAFDDNYLGSSIIVASSASEGVVDRLKTHSIVFDEAGKIERADVFTRHNTSKLTAAQGLSIHGYLMYPSTVEELTDGGKEYQQLLDGSMFYDRQPSTGQTKTGLLTFFNPCYDGMDGFIDPWGYSVIDDPTDEQIEYADNSYTYVQVRMGAKKHMQKYYDELLTSGDQSYYRQQLRKNPMRYADCWIGTSGDTGINIIKIDKRLAELRRRSETRRVSFRWEHSKWGRVAMEYDESGKFVVSEVFKERANQWFYGDSIYSETHDAYIQAKYPSHASSIILGADQFDWKNKAAIKLSETKSRQSDGAIAAFWKYDDTVDSPETPRKERDSERFVMTYLHRPNSLEEYIEDVAMATIWYGGLLNVESNKTDILRAFVDNGLGGYLYRAQDAYGKYSDKYGTWTGVGSKDKYFSKTKDYIEFRGHKEKHVKYLEQVKDIKGPEDLTNQDLFTAGALCLVGVESNYSKHLDMIETTDINLSGTFLDF